MRNWFGWTCVALGVAILVFVGVVTAQSSPSLTDSEKTAIRKFQLDDARFSNAIQQRWLAIYQTPEYQQIIDLQKQQQKNAQAFQSFIAGVCKEAGWTFSLESDDLKCVQTPKPAEKK